MLVGLYIYSAKIEPNWIQTVSIDITIPNLSPGFNNFKVVQISDLHISRSMPEKRLHRIIKLVNQQNPDAIAITGDFVTHYLSFDTTKLEKNLSKLVSQEGIFSVLGNHDRWRKKTDRVKESLSKSNVNNLDNQVAIIERGAEKLAFAGVDDPYWGEPDLYQVINQLPANTPAILLVHEPDYLGKSSKTHKFALQLSGHSHGGQIRFPFFKPPILPTGGRKYFLGWNTEEDTLEYTNRGLGMTGLSFRLNSRPEITVFTLHPDNE
ncbi:MAG: metallophosphoesterase [Pleurocapsa sp.]